MAYILTMLTSPRILTPLLPALVLSVVAAFVWNLDATIGQSSNAYSGIAGSSHIVAEASAVIAGIAVCAAVIVSVSRLITRQTARRTHTTK